MDKLKKTILITGGAGFLGSHLCEKYVKEGHQVVAMDNLQTTFTADNIEHLLKFGNFKFIKHDIIEPYDFKERFDWILNLACPAQCINLQWDLVHTLKTSVHGVINMLELARRDNARILQASTSEVYGHRPRNPQQESDPGEVNTLGPRACYDEGKRVSETLMMDYRRQYGVDVKLIRIFNTYGPHMYVRDGRVMSNFIISALKNEPITIYGDGSYTRSFQYYTDLVDGIDRMMKKDDFTGPVNLGNPHEITIRELAQTIIRLTESKSKLVYKESVTDDPVRRQPDIGLAKRELGWEPKVSLEEGVKKTVEYFRTVNMPDKKILVFATTYKPDMGVAEKALDDLTKLMPETEFHVVTVKSRRSLAGYERDANVHIYRLGSGNFLGKYLFPLRGAKKARELGQEHKFRFVWSIMASYGALAALLYKRRHRQAIFLLSFDRTELESKGALKSKLLLPLLKFIFRKADTVYLSEMDMEKNATFFEAVKDIAFKDSYGKNFVDQVRRSYNQLLNQQEKKLDRPL